MISLHIVGDGANAKPETQQMCEAFRPVNSMAAQKMHQPQWR